MRILIIGAGQVGSTVVEALHDEHEVTVVDVDASRLDVVAHRYDVKTVKGNGASRRTLQDAGIRDADLLIACTSRDEPNLIAAMLARKISPQTRIVVRTSELDYLEAWYEGQLDIDLIVSSELETAYAISRIIGVPAARQTDVFADGQVQIVEFDVEREPDGHGVIGVTLREAAIPPDSKVAAIIRGGRTIVPRGTESIQTGDRIIVIGSPRAARQWSEIMARDRRRLDHVVIYGAGSIGVAVARVLLQQNIRVRMIEASPERASEVAKLLPGARVFNATGIDPDFLERERIGRSPAVIFAMRDDAKNHYAASLVKLHGAPFTIGVVHERVSAAVFEQAGVDVAINPREATAEELVRFAHDPRTRQVAMLEGDRYEILDVTVRTESELANTRFRDLPMTGSLIGALVRDGKAIFPHGDEVLLPGDRAIIFTEARRASEVERAL